MSGVVKSRFAKCWDCRHATNAHQACPWSSVLQPVPGWVAEKVSNKGFETYLVMDCPLFEEDAKDGGARRIKERGKK